VLSQGGDGRPAASFNLPTNTTLPDSTFVTSTTLRASSPPVTAGVRTPSSFVSIAVNATNTSGVAGKATTKLQSAGYNAVAPGDATPTVKAATKSSVVYYVPGFEREGAAVASLFGLPATALKPLPTPPPSTSIKDAKVILLVGPDLRLP
jgi:hypothetical protein